VGGGPVRWRGEGPPGGSGEVEGRLEGEDRREREEDERREREEEGEGEEGRRPNCEGELRVAWGVQRVKAV
jgi:hypothetical protein